MRGQWAVYARYSRTKDMGQDGQQGPPRTFSRVGTRKALNLWVIQKEEVDVTEGTW